jgi:DNA-directed RNA polymerase specialized sigma24 family protein
MGTVLPDTLSRKHVSSSAEPTLATNTEPQRLEPSRHTPARLTPAHTEALFVAHASAVYRYARSRLPAAEAEDVVAEVFAVAWRKGELPDNPRAWLLGVARRVMANQVRAQQRRIALVERVRAHPVPAGQDGARLVGELDELRRAMAAAELSTPEVAQVLGCTTATAATRVHRARRRLRAAYEQLTEEGS